MGAPLQYRLADGSLAAWKTVSINAGLCAQLGWALERLGKTSQATRELLDALARAPSSVRRCGMSMWDDGGASSFSGRLAHNWLWATGQGAYKEAGDALRAAARMRFGGYAASGNASRHDSWELERQAKALGLPKAGSDEALWNGDDELSHKARLMAQLPASKAPDPQRAISVASDASGEVDARVDWVRQVGALWPKAAAEWKAAGLAYERDPCASTLSALEGSGWAREEAVLEALRGELWVAVGQSSSGATTFISPNGSEMADLARGKTFGSSEDAIAWASRHRGVGAIKLGWTLEGFEPAPGRKAPAQVAKALAASEKAALAAAAEPASEPVPKTASARL